MVVSQVFLLPEKRLQRGTIFAFQPANGFLFDLSHAFAREAKRLADFVKRHLVAVYAEKTLNNVAFTVAQPGERPVDFLN